MFSSFLGDKELSEGAKPNAGVESRCLDRGPVHLFIGFCDLCRKVTNAGSEIKLGACPGSNTHPSAAYKGMAVDGDNSNVRKNIDFTGAGDRT